MKLHLPVFLRKSLLSCLSAFIVCTVGSGAAWAEAQNLTFEGGTLTWDTQSESFTDESDAAAAFTVGDNVSFTGESTVTLGEDIAAGTLAIEQGADVTIDLDVYELNVDRIELSGLLDMGYSLHIGEGTTLAVQSAGAVLDSNLVLGDKGGFEVGAAASLNNNLLTLQGNTSFTLTAAGDGKTYTLLTGVSGLLDAQGNAISLDSSNNAASLYFDTTQPGTGFWADATLQLSADGILRLVRHNESVKAAVTISTRRTGSVDYQYYEGVHFADIEYTAGFGGAIDGGTITLSNNGSVTFSGNTASGSGGAIWGDTITLSNNGSVKFSGNTTSDPGGAIEGGTITLSNNGSVTFSENESYGDGGAVSGFQIEVNNNNSVIFCNNAVRYTNDGGSYAPHGGAIMLASELRMVDNFLVRFDGNTVQANGGEYNDACGGAIGGVQRYSYGQVDAFVVELLNNDTIIFCNNKAEASNYYAGGGAIYAEKNGGVTIDGNVSVKFENNKAIARGESSGCSYAEGGAIYGPEITLSNNSSVIFDGNGIEATVASAAGPSTGGALYSYETVSLSENGIIIFSKNSVDSCRSRGGAIDSYNVSIIGNSQVEFRENRVSANFLESLDVCEESIVAYGGAIDGREITLCDNDSVYFIGNSAISSVSDARGGAIYTWGNLGIHNNDSVLFEKNAEVRNGTYRLCSINASVSGAEISLSAAVGKSIEFRDSVYIASGTTVNLNADYTDAEGKVHKQQGDILFTGATTVDDLYEVKGDVAGTESEILASRTSEVNALTELYGGRLRVEDGAIYQGRGITAMEGSGATVRVQNAELSHSGYDLTFNAGTTFELIGNNTITGNVRMLEGSTLAFSALGSHGMTSISGNLTFGDTLTIAGLDTWQGENQILLYTQGNVTGWDADNITIQGTSVNNLTWVNDFLVLNYNSDTFNLAPFKGDIIYTKRLTGNVDISYYINVAFEGNTVSSKDNVYGGAIDGLDVILHNNGNVTFCENTASTYYGADGDDFAPYARGGAIYGDSIALRGNGSVVFSENTAASETYLTDDTFAGGGAIYGDNILLSENNEVSFVGNAAYVQYVQPVPSHILLDLVGIESYEHMPIGCQTSRGGAIYAEGDLSIRNNGSVLFEKNVEVFDHSYRLRSIYAGGSGNVISLSAAEGKSIEFRDSVYIGSGATVNLNEDYTDAAGVVHKQAGDILFTGAYAETHLNDMLEAAGYERTATAEEILSSRTTAVNTLTNLYGGRLRVEDGAIYQGQGITAHAGSEATVLVKDATLSHSGYDLTFNAGTTLELAGANSITGNVQIHSGSTLLFCYEGQQKSVAAMTLSGVLNMAEGAIVQLKGYENIRDTVILISLEGARLQGWNKDKLTLIDEHGSDMQDTLVWWDNVLYYTHAPLEHQYVTWANATGDGKWNNMSANWEADGENYAWTNGVNVIFDGNRGETVTLEGDVMVRSMQVTNAGNYQIQYGDFASLTVNETLQVDSGSSVSLGGTVSAGSVQNAGNLSVKGDLTVQEAVSSSGSLEVDGSLRASSLIASSLLAEVLTLTDATATNRIGGNVTLSGAATVAGTLEVEGGLTAASLQASGLSATALTLTDASAISRIGSSVSLSGAATVAGSLEVEGGVTAASLQASGLSATALTLTDASAISRIGSSVSLSGAATVAGTLEVSGSFASATLQVKSLTADGSITTGKLTGDSATLTALNGNVELTNEHESLNGNSNVITATGGDVRLTDDMTGSRNIITAKAVDGVGGSILRGNGRALWASIAGQYNELTADGRIELESINQGNNTLIAGGAIVNDGGTISINSINGSTNTLTATNGSIRVGNIGNATKSDNNRLTAAGHVYVQGQLTGDGNYLESNKAPGDGNSISIWNGINGSGNRILANAGNIAMGGGDLTGDNNTLTSVNGNVSVRNVSGSGNTLSAGGNISLGSVTGDYNTLTACGRITAAAISGAGNAVTAGMLTTTGGLQGSTLTLTNGDASNSIGGNVALSGAATVAGALQVTGALAAEGTVSLASTAEITGDMSAAALVLNAGASLDVGGTLSAAQVTLNNLSTTAPTLTVGSFAAGDTIFSLDAAALNALNLGHGESVVIARADSAIGSGFNAWLGAGSTSLDAAVYRYDISVSGADVLVSMDYANWGTRVWYEGAWVGKDGWSEYMIAGYDAVNGVETVDLGGESIQATNLFLAQEDSTSTSVLSNGSIEAACTEIVEGNLTIAEDASLDSDELIAAGHDILLQGELIVNNGSIGTLSGTTGTLVIGGEVSVDSNVTLGILDNSGTLDIGSHKLNVAAVVSNGGNVTAGEVVVHNRYGNPAEFDTLVADKVTVKNTSSKYPDYLSVGGGSVIGELVADQLEVREGSATLGSTAKQTEQKLQSIALQKGADLVLQGQTGLSVTDSVAMTAGSEVQIQSGSTLQNGAVALSAAPGTAAAQFSSKTGGNLVMMQQAVGLCIQDVLLVNTSISAAEGTEVMLSGVEGSENVHLLGGADFSLTFADNKADVGMAVIENSSPVTGITLSAGSTLTLVMDPTNNDFRDYSLVINMSGFEYEGGSLAATGGITDLNAAGIYLGGWLGEVLAAQGVVQEGVGNLESPEVPGGSVPTVSYTYSTDNNVGMIISIHGLSVPEPTTTTLSLLALSALAARRRRR